MKTKLLLFAFLLIAVMNSWAQTNGPITTIPTVAICADALTVDVPITVSDFNNVGALSLTFGFNPAQLSSPSIVSRNDAFDITGHVWDSFVYTTDETLLASGTYKVSGRGNYASDGVSLDPNTVLFTLRFSILTFASTTNISLVENIQGTACEYSGVAPTYIVFNDMPTATYYLNGGVAKNTLTANTIAGAQTICNASTADLTGNTVTGGTAISYQWVSSSTLAGTYLPVVTGGTSKDYTTSALSADTWFKRVTTSLLYGVNCSSTSDAVKVTVDPTTVAGAVTGGTSVCNGSTSGLLTLGAHTGAIVKWQSSLSPFTSWSDIVYTSATYTSEILSATTQFRAVIKSGTCLEENSTATTVTVDPTTVGGSVTGGTTICNGSPSGELTLSGHTGSVLRWQSGVFAAGAWAYTNITNTGTTYTSGALAENTRFRAVIKSGTCVYAVSSITLVTVNPTSVGGTVSSDQTICYNSSPASLTLSGNTGSVIRWEKSSNASFSPLTIIPGTSTTLTGATIGALTSNTYFRAVVKSGTCPEINSSAILISVDPTTAGGTVSGTSAICSGSNSGLLTLSGQTGSVLKWQSGVLNGAIYTYTDIDNTSNTNTYTSGALTETTRFRAVVKSGACLVANSIYKQILVRPNPTFTAGTVSESNCFGDDVAFATSGLLPSINNTFNGVITYGTTVLPVSRNVLSDALGNAAYTVPGMTPDNYTYELVSIVVSGCTTTLTGLTPASFVVHPLPTASISGTTTVCVAATSPEITFTGADGTAPYVFTYTKNTGTPTTATAPLTSINVAQSTVSSGSFIYDLVSVSDFYGCSQLQTGTETITIDPTSVGGSITGTSSVTYGSSTGTMTLAGSTGLVQRWEKKLNTGSWTNITNTNLTYSETPTSAGTWYYRALLKSGVCSETYSSEFSVTVNLKPLSITADNKSKTYDGFGYSPFTVTYNGFVTGEDASNLSGTLAFSGNATTAVNVGNYTIIPSGQTSGNYNISYSNGSLAINSAFSPTVINNHDAGYGSLRDVVANVATGGTVNFDAGINGQNIILTSGTIVIDKNITFDNCTHASGITISGSGSNFTIDAGKCLTISGCSKITVSGTIVNNAGVSGLVLASGSSFIYNACNLSATSQRTLNSGWHLFGSPFNKNLGASLANLTPSAGSVQLKPYINGTNWNAAVTSPVFSLVPGVGYAVKPNTSFTASLSGTLFCTPCLNTVSLMYNGTLPTQSWNLVANPYTSYLNWNLLGKTNISTTLYIWDNTLYPTLAPIATASYFRTYNSTNGVGVPAGTTGFIAPFQGFFVKANYTAPKLSFPLTALTHTTANFYKDASNTEILLRLKVETETSSDELAVCKNSDAKNSFEEFDSEKMFNGLPIEMYTQSLSGEKLIINTVENTNTIIPVGIFIANGSKAKLTAFAMESGEQVYLEDRTKGKFISLTENTSYDFDFNSNEILGRFFIRFGNINAPLIASDVKVFANDQQLNIIAQTGEEIQQVEVYSLTGACVFKSNVSGSNSFNAKIDLSSAIYLVRVKTSVASQNVKLNWK